MKWNVNFMAFRAQKGHLPKYNTQRPLPQRFYGLIMFDHVYFMFRNGVINGCCFVSVENSTCGIDKSK